MKVRVATFEDVKPYAGRASRERVAITDTGSTEWFLAVADGDTIGVAGLIKIASGLRIKGVWIEPAHRGNGLGTELTTHLIRVAEDRCASFIEALAWNPGFYEERGFCRENTLPTGAVRVRRVL